MPEKPDHGKRKHPAARRRKPPARAPRPDRAGIGYVELRCKSNFSFLRGASHPEELVERAVELGHVEIGIADVNTLAGVVRMHCAAKSAGLPLLVGAEITPEDGPAISLYAMNRVGYGQLARLITTGHMQAPKGECYLNVEDVLSASADLIGILHEKKGTKKGTFYFSKKSQKTPGILNKSQKSRMSPFLEAFGDRLYLGAEAHLGERDRARLAAMQRLSRRTGVPLVAVNDVHYHVPARRFLQDVLVCVREHCTIADAGGRLFPNGERYLKPPEEMARLFAEYPQAIRRTVEIAERCQVSLDELRYEYPPELCPPNTTATRYLAELTRSGANRIYNGKIPDKVRELIEHELELIAQLAYEHYFLTVWDLVRFGRSRDILCQGRGSAANSAVCFCLGITSVDPDRIDVLFERFVSAERNEPPDIDVDFEHERREEVIQYIYQKYGRERAGIAAEVITYRPRSAVRDVGKALGLSLDKLNAIAGRMEWWSNPERVGEHLRMAGLDPTDRVMRCFVELCRQIQGFPRHLSQHVGGFVITAGPLCEMAPIENAAMPDRTFIEWDKDDIDALGILKIDVLALGMLTAIRKCFALISRDDRSWHGLPGRASTGRMPVPRRRPMALADVPPEDPSVYDMICHADTVGVFQIESRAQMSMLPRLQPRCFYDLVIEVAIVRPGPIQGGMVHPYLRRRSGDEPVSYPSPQVRDVLQKTLGVPLFQEQAMRLAVVAAGFTPGEADRLRRSMAAWRHSGSIEKFKAKLINGMLANGYSDEYAERIFNQLRGFGDYGFPESHAASFALLVYVSCWLKRYHPAAFAAAVINSQPMGFYAPAQLVRDAREHGVCVRGVDVNFSEYDCLLEAPADESEAKGDRHLASNSSGVCQSKSARSQSPFAVPTQRDAPPHTWGRDGPALRLGMRLIKGISSASVEELAAARRDGPFRSVSDVVRRSGVSRATLARLAAADAFGSLGLDRRQAVWAVLGVDDELPLFAGLEDDEPVAPLPAMTLRETIIEDYDVIGMSLRAHPMSLVRADLSPMGVLTAGEMRSARQGQNVQVAGIVLVRQRPSTALGIIFMTLEDETGTANLVIRPKVYEKYRGAARSATALLAGGRIERQGEVVHLQVTRLTSLNDACAQLRVVSRDFH